MKWIKNLLGQSRISTISLLLAVFAQGPVAAQQLPPSKSNNTSGTTMSLSEKLDELMTAYTAAGLFNGTVLIRQDGKTLLRKGYGFSNLTLGKTNNAETKYALYSITKAMTATLILQQVQTGQLKLNDKLSQFYPSFPAADSITIEHLLTHTSGLYPYNNDFSMPTGSDVEMLKFLSGKSLRFNPGTRWEYCNTGYYLLGFIIEKITGLSYAKALEKYIFQPLHMNNSGVDFNSHSATNKATGYRFLFPDTCKAATLYPYAELFSAGGVWSTAEDMYRFHSAMQQFRLINQSLTIKATTVFRSNYGYGWFIDSLSGRQIISHSGGAAGFRTYLIRIPENNTCIVLLGNAENIDVTAIKNNLLHILFQQPYKLPVNIAIPEVELAALEGTYEIEAGRSLYVTKLGNRLTGQVSGQQTTLLLAQDNQKFLVDGMDGWLEFKYGKNAVYDTVFLFRKGKKYTGIKIQAGWGLAGSALTGGWNGPDLRLQRTNSQSKTWRAENVLLHDGVIKFRYNNDWTLNYGIATDSIDLSPGGKNIPVSAGIYTITLNISDPDKPTYLIESIKKTGN